ncbi:MAG: GIY-YIG nuclease family protein [Ardenticatenales bacterium]|nr:GIY-YIG nuclease family protein [Ardenticatenales bacterium]
MRVHRYFVYILGNRGKMLYVGVTNNIRRRVWEHKTKRNPKSFTARYDIDRLLYFEEFRYVLDAIAREKEIKGWRREKKIRLIERMNHRWRDLSEGWFASSP